ncbi:MAG: hypothetical protein COB39_03320 [Marinosulfonomonas sp.]|nr:MAG: hypothetical protein COB39_03320 [Marinosulfonomonas sp.]
MPEFVDIIGLLDHIDQSELEQIAGIGSFNSPEGRSLDEDKINAAIKFAGDMVKGYMARRYPIVATVTPDQTPDLLQGYVADIVRWRLRSRTGNRNSTSDEVTARYKDAKDWLKDVSRNVINVDFEGADGGHEATLAGSQNLTGTVGAIIRPARAVRILDGY